MVLIGVNGATPKGRNQVINSQQTSKTEQEVRNQEMTSLDDVVQNDKENQDDNGPGVSKTMENADYKKSNVLGNKENKPHASETVQHAKNDKHNVVEEIEDNQNIEAPKSIDTEGQEYQEITIYNATGKMKDELVHIEDNEATNEVNKKEISSREIKDQIIESINEENDIKDELLAGNKERVVKENKDDILNKKYEDDDDSYHSHRLRKRKKAISYDEPKVETKLPKYIDDDEYDMKCPRCKYVAPTRIGLSNHLRKHAKDNTPLIYTCSICSDTFITNTELKEHKKSHNETFLCNPCKVAFSDHYEYMVHMLTHRNCQTYNCNECGKVFERRNLYKSHIAVHYDRAFECDICNRTYRSEGQLKTHLKSHSEQVKCGECGKLCKETGYLKYHMISHTGLKVYQCHYCGKGFANSAQQITHMRIHTNERPYECKFCLQKFKQSTDLNRHLDTHATEKSKECDVCGKKFYQSESLVSHMRTHTNSQLFPCPECDRKFTIRASLRVHVIHAHMNDRSHKCDICNIAFKTNAGLRRHNRSKTHKNNSYGAMLKAKNSEQLI